MTTGKRSTTKNKRGNARKKSKGNAKPKPKPVPSPKASAAQTPATGTAAALLAAFLSIVSEWQNVFPQQRTYLRAVRQALGGLICLGRRTISRIIWTNGGQHKPWRAEYFLFSRCKWNPSELFAPILRRALPYCPDGYVGVAVDATHLRKSGPRIQQASYQHDPLSPKFHPNLMFALRFLQASLLVPLYKKAPVGARALPIAFEHSPVVKKPKRKPQPKSKGKANAKGKGKGNTKTEQANRELQKEWQQYKAARKVCNLSTHFVQLMKHLRDAFDACDNAARTLVLAVDNSFCNRTVFTAAAVHGVELIARAKKNIVLCLPAPAGSRRVYDPGKFTPEQVRQDGSSPWKRAHIFYGSRFRDVFYKQVAEVLWQGGARRRPLRLFVVRATPYRKRKSSRMYYRQHAYLLTTDLVANAAQLLQIYFDRWQIEVNHREEKDTLGIGQAQLWNLVAVPRQPAFAVAGYSTMLLSSLLAFGPERSSAYLPLPNWRKRAKRPSALDLVTLLRQEVTQHPEQVAHLGLNFSDRAINAAAAA
ncbi:MAG: transposase [Bryobacteraceae bacterium]